jgi:hypothetical protein
MVEGREATTVQALGDGLAGAVREALAGVA